MKQTIQVADKPTADETKSIAESNAAKLDSIAQRLESGGMLADPEHGLAALKQQIDELKNYVGNGKRNVASAITAKGIPTATDAGFAVIIQNIDKIVTLMQGTQDATAGAEQVLSGYTAYAKGNKITGSIPSQGAQTITPGTSAKYVEAGCYLSGRQTIQGDGNLIPENIKKGVSIFGVEGSHEGSGYSITYNDSGGKMNYVINQKVALAKVRFTPDIGSLPSTTDSTGRWALLTPEASNVRAVYALDFVDIKVLSITGKVYPNRPLVWHWDDSSISFKSQTGQSSYTTYTGSGRLAMRQSVTLNGDYCSCSVNFVDAWCQLG
ncbi:hypothetical protein D7V86_24860 [bacterium D16-51]|nr:hypothetical protein D7V96_23490 [bacterium D16-59]RKI53611.1 hypothetical protein D7V86_24860 [bacterium D16-51]